jgi:hypothetical protein
LVREITVVDRDLEFVDGIWMTNPVRTAFDCGRWLRLTEGAVVADALSHAGLADRDSLRSYYRTHRGLRGVRKVAAILELMDPLAESPMETRVRLLLIQSGLPRPESQFVIRDGTGGFVGRADFAFTEQRVIVEYDGAHHWEQRAADDRRRDAMRSLGWIVIVLSRSDYYETPGETVEKVRRVLASRTK